MKLRLIATAILAFLVAVPVIATSDRFTDVPQDHEHRTAIDWAYGRGLFKGYPDRSFKPDRALLVEVRRAPSERWITLVPPSGMFGGMNEAQKATSKIRKTGSLPAGWKVMEQ